jgi:hypothetical protein
MSAQVRDNIVASGRFERRPSSASIELGDGSTHSPLRDKFEYKLLIGFQLNGARYYVTAWFAVADMSDRYSLILCNQFLKQTGLQVFIGDPTLWNPGMITAPEEIEFVLDSIPSDYLTPTDDFDPQLVTLAPELSFAQRSAILSLLTSESISSVFSKFLPDGGIKGAPPFSIELLPGFVPPRWPLVIRTPLSTLLLSLVLCWIPASEQNSVSATLKMLLVVVKPLKPCLRASLRFSLSWPLMMCVSIFQSACLAFLNWFIPDLLCQLRAIVWPPLVWTLF